VLRDGRVVATMATRDRRGGVVRAMTGRSFVAVDKAPAARACRCSGNRSDVRAPGGWRSSTGRAFGRAGETSASPASPATGKRAGEAITGASARHRLGRVNGIDVTAAGVDRHRAAGLAHIPNRAAVGGGARQAPRTSPWVHAPPIARRG
jgi:hypothetical protein